jgi:putative methyltransferase (TIGR04325 family)
MGVADWMSSPRLAATRRLAVRVLPPVLTDRLRRMSRESTAGEWEYRAGGWPGSDAELRGWDSQSIAEAQLARWQPLVEATTGTAPLGLSIEASHPSDADYASHNTVMAFGYVLGRAAQGKNDLSILDWGGGIGQYALFARSLFPEIQIDYHCRDLPFLTRAGRQVLRAATFHDSDDDALGGTYDLVMASSSLQYSQDWKAVLSRLAVATGAYLYITRQPFVASEPSFVVVQRPYTHGYRTEYPGWFLNRGEFLDEAAACGMELVREFLIDERPHVPRAPEQADYRGFLFRPRSRPKATSS